MKKHLLVLFIVAGCSLTFAQAPRKTAVAVMDLRGSGLSETDAKFLTDRLIIELQRTDVFDVLERDKMDEILKEQGFQQTGTCDQMSCLVEAGRLLPVEKMIGGSVGKFAETYSIQIKLIDLKTAKVEKTAIKDFSQKMDYLLTDGMKFVAKEISIIDTGSNNNLKSEMIVPNQEIKKEIKRQSSSQKSENKYFYWGASAGYLMPLTNLNGYVNSSIGYSLVVGCRNNKFIYGIEAGYVNWYKKDQIISINQKDAYNFNYKNIPVAAELKYLFIDKVITLYGSTSIGLLFTNYSFVWSSSDYFTSGKETNYTISLGTGVLIKISKNIMFDVGSKYSYGEMKFIDSNIKHLNVYSGIKIVK